MPMLFDIHTSTHTHTHTFLSRHAHLGSSVLEMIKAFEEASGKKVEHKIMERRAGDSTAVWAGTEKAEKVSAEKRGLLLPPHLLAHSPSSSLPLSPSGHLPLSSPSGAGLESQVQRAGHVQAPVDLGHPIPPGLRDTHVEGVILVTSLICRIHCCNP
jgi:hypothetical protein